MDTVEGMALKFSRSFTLLEAVVTLTILGVMAVASVAMFSGVRDRTAASKVDAAAVSLDYEIRAAMQFGDQLHTAYTSVIPHIPEDIAVTFIDSNGDSELSNGEAIVVAHPEVTLQIHITADDSLDNPWARTWVSA